MTASRGLVRPRIGVYEGFYNRVGVEGPLVLFSKHRAHHEIRHELFPRKHPKLLNLTKKVHDVLQLTRLYTVFDIMDDEAVAVKSFRQSAAATG
jgi:hypothetical protein